MTSSPRRVAVLGGNRIPFARSNSAYAHASCHDMLTTALDGLIERFSLQGERLGEVVAGAVLKHSRDRDLHARPCSARALRRRHPPTTSNRRAARVLRRSSSSPTRSPSDRSTWASPAASTRPPMPRSPSTTTCKNSSARSNRDAPPANPCRRRRAGYRLSSPARPRAWPDRRRRRRYVWVRRWNSTPKRGRSGCEHGRESTSLVRSPISHLLFVHLTLENDRARLEDRSGQRNSVVTQRVSRCARLRPNAKRGTRTARARRARTAPVSDARGRAGGSRRMRARKPHRRSARRAATVQRTRSRVAPLVARTRRAMPATILDGRACAAEPRAGGRGRSARVARARNPAATGRRDRRRRCGQPWRTCKASCARGREKRRRGDASMRSPRRPGPAKCAGCSSGSATIRLVHGVILQQPLPRHLDVRAIADAMPPHKDVDGANPSTRAGWPSAAARVRRRRGGRHAACSSAARAFPLDRRAGLHRRPFERRRVARALLMMRAGAT